MLATGTLTHCTAGHPPPLLLPSGRPARHPPPSGAGPLGATGTFPAGSAQLDELDGLLLYSDGVLGRGRRDPAPARSELARVATAAAPERLSGAFLDGVSVPHRADRDLLTLEVAPGSVADQIMALVGLPHRHDHPVRRDDRAV